MLRLRNLKTSSDQLQRLRFVNCLLDFTFLRCRLVNGKKIAILLLSFQKVKCISLIYAKTSDQNYMYVVKKNIGIVNIQPSFNDNNSSSHHLFES